MKDASAEVNASIDPVDALIARLKGQAAVAWYAAADVLIKKGAYERALVLLDAAEQAVRETPVICYLKAITFRADGSVVRAEQQYRRALALLPDYSDAAFGLAGLLRDAGRLEAARKVIELFSIQRAGNADLSLQCASFLKQIQRADAAADVCERALSFETQDARLTFMAGELAATLGRFEHARKRFDETLNDPAFSGGDWFAWQALADMKHYTDAQDPELLRFRNAAEQPGSTRESMASALYALGKGLDDVGDCAGAAECWRRANALTVERLPWNPGQWEREVEARLHSPRPRFALEPNPDFIPIFIVGMPRSGTTLLAELLARSPEVRNRGELNLIPFIRNRLDQAQSWGEEALFEASRLFYTHVVQDDAPARFYIDKNALNFRHLDLIQMLFPQARVIWCCRNPRDTALSLWQRSFVPGELNFSYRFADIIRVEYDCIRLMQRWRQILDLSISTIDYEELVRDPDAALAKLGETARIPVAGPADRNSATSTIATSSLWQARQAIDTRSIGRWRAYAGYIPELSNVESSAD